MPWSALKQAVVTQHPGSSTKEVEDEPDWGQGHNHRIGYLNRQGRLAGLTHDGDHDPYEKEEDKKFREDAMQKYRQLQQRSKAGDLLNFQDIMKNQTVRMFPTEMKIA